MTLRACFFPLVLLLGGCGLGQQASLAWNYRTCTEGGVDPKDIIAACSVVIDGEKDDKRKLLTVHRQRADVYVAFEEREKAIADYDRMIELDPNDAFAYVQRGALRGQLGDMAGARKDFEDAVRLDPGSPTAWANLATVHSKADDMASALPLYERAISLQADFRPALGGRCWSLAVLNRDLDSAERDCNKVLEHDPDEYNTLNTRGFLNFRRGEHEAAIADYDAAIAGDPKVGSSFYIRGLAKRALGRNAEAEADIAQGIALQANVAERYARFGVQP